MCKKAIVNQRKRARKMNAINDLYEVLKTGSAGPMSAETLAKILPLLAKCWHEFAGSTDSKMRFYKVARDGGPQETAWHPPILSLVVARHPTTDFGSGRVDKQLWSLDFEEITANHRKIGWSQSRRTATRLFAKQLAVQVCDAVKQGRHSDSKYVNEGVLVWEDDYIIVRQSKLISSKGFADTVSGRRRRFREKLKPLMAAIGWHLAKTRPALNFKKQDRD